MRTIGNVLWLVLAGWWLAIGYVIAGILNCITIIGIPFGVQSFKLAGYALWPFGRVVVERPGASPTLGCLGNVIWLVLGGSGPGARPRPRRRPALHHDHRHPARPGIVQDGRPGAHAVRQGHRPSGRRRPETVISDVRY